MSIGTIIVLIIAAIIIIIMSICESWRRDEEIKKRNDIYRRLDTEVKNYTDYLIYECGFKHATVKTGPLGFLSPTYVLGVEELSEEFDKYEGDYKKLGLNATVSINGHVFDIRESKYNLMMVENDRILTDYKMQMFFAHALLKELETKHSKLLDNTWRKISTKYKIEKAIPSYDDLLCGKMRGKEIDADAVIAKWNKGKRKHTQLAEYELKERAEKQKNINMLIDEFAEYIEHKHCYDECYCDKSIEECKSIRKKFEKDDYLHD